MKDFDAERQARNRLVKTQQFKLGGETFSMRTHVRPDVIAIAEEISENASARETLDAFDATIIAFIEPKGKAHERYRALRAREDDPVTLQDILEVIRWLVEEYTRRPTSPPARSPRGQRSTTTRSTGGSRSKART